MIFSIGDHREQIKAGIKTQTRRRWDGYFIGKTYSIQPGRGKEGIPDGRIKIIDKSQEFSPIVLSEEDAQAEGGYTIMDFETLYDRMYPGWVDRWAYKFVFVPKE